MNKPTFVLHRATMEKAGAEKLGLIYVGNYKNR